ncbi:recombinational DNA repair protein [Aeromonas diversa CDC 2478-85]|uniref:Recombinational DNA repair protein n=1 Tax=Aeromonas diversa CDC 2478-85 TaxID=1268237 RepID=N9VEL6_9GAMM|nr:recombinational DNA repair protein [Aeromonas diversa CDC 2478-85]
MQVSFVLLVEVQQTFPSRPLGVGVDVHLHHAVGDGFADLFQGRAGATVEYEVQALGRDTELLGDVFLGGVQDGGGQLDVTRLVNTVHVAEGGSDGEARADLGQTLVSVSHVFRLGVQSGLIHVAVVHTVFFAAGATQFQLESHVHLGHAGQVLAADVDVLFQRLFGQIQHVGGEQRLAGLGEVLLTGVQQTVDPRQQLLGGVVGVQDDRHTVGFGHGVNVLGTGDGTQDGGLLTFQLQALTGGEHGAAVGELNDDRGFYLGGRFQYGVDGVGTNAVNGRQSEAVFLGDSEYLLNVITGDNAGFYEVENLLRHVSRPILVCR